MKYIPLFIAIQVASLLLMIAGIPICAVLAYGKFARWDGKQWHWPAWAWIWDNEEDGDTATWYSQQHANWSLAHREFIWTALRNSVNNLRYVRYVSGKGRPLWLRNWQMRGKTYYAKAGWSSAGFPVMSAGAGKW
jgi:hypothetical protein